MWCIFFILKTVYCVYSSESPQWGDSNENNNIPPCYRKTKEILIMPPNLVLLSTLTGSNYPCFEIIFMVPKVFEPLKFDSIFFYLKYYKIRLPHLTWPPFPIILHFLSEQFTWPFSMNCDSKLLKWVCIDLRTPPPFSKSPNGITPLAPYYTVVIACPRRTMSFNILKLA